MEVAVSAAIKLALAKISSKFSKRWDNIPFGDRNVFPFGDATAIERGLPDGDFSCFMEIRGSIERHRHLAD
jgi:hypothetical protein